MLVNGTAFPPKSSERYAAQLDLAQKEQVCMIVDGERFISAREQLNISAQVGNLPIRFQLPNGWVFVAERSASLDQWLNDSRPGWLERAESNLVAWLVASLACVALLLASYWYLLPWVTQQVTQAVPDSVVVQLGEQVFESLDSHWQPSQIAPQEQDAIRARVKNHIDQLGELRYPIELEFRASGGEANAFALPGGKLVLLDGLVAMAETPEQLDSVILHELGHVHHQHMMNRVVRSSILSVAVALITGESSGIIDNLTGMGVFLLNSGYSREAEMEADHYAKQAMQLIYGTSEPMAEMFEHLSESHTHDVPKWLSTHPEMQQRIEKARSEKRESRNEE
ncbi:M48 family metallopeptidase [Vibrio sp. WXL210]|uniref:M48 family metallopeptidase n=1 Tax=Vibrio sp. WXL210 TaxID=3450709 RepID=UPI003EC69E42